MTERQLLVHTAFTEDGRVSAVAIEHAAARVFDTTTGELLATPEVANPVEALVICIDCSVLPQRLSPSVAMGTDTGTFFLYDTATHSVLAEAVLTEVGVPVAAVRFVHGTTYVAALAATGSIAIFDAVTGACVASKLRTPVVRASALAVVMSATETMLSAAVAIVGGAALCAAVDVPLHALSKSADGVTCDQRCLFTGHTASPDEVIALFSGEAAFTVTRSDGLIRLWDLRRPLTVVSAPSDSAANRCRASLAAGRRLISALSVNVESTVTHVAATAITGELLVWQLNAQSYVADNKNRITPIPIFARIASAAGPGRILAASFKGQTSIVLVRGRWATPVFETIAATVLDEAHVIVSRGSLGTLRLPFIDAAEHRNPSDHIIPNVRKWSKQPRLSLAPEIQPFSAIGGGGGVPLSAAMDDLPIALRTSEGGEDQSSPVTGIIVPLHQALHAKDKSLVMELIVIAARSQAEVLATIDGLLLPYLIELVHMLADRATTANLSSPVHEWLATILKRRAKELQQVARKEGPLGAALRTVLIPVLAHYRDVALLHSCVSSAFGRSSVFKSARAAHGATDARAFINNFEEPRQVGRVRFLRVNNGGVVLGDDGNDESLVPVVRRGRRGTKNSRLAKRRRIASMKEALIAEDGGDTEDLLAGGRGERMPQLDDAVGSEESGDDGSSAMEQEESSGIDEESFDDEDLEALGDGTNSPVSERDSVEDGDPSSDDEDEDDVGLTAEDRAEQHRRHGRLTVDTDADGTEDGSN